MEIKLAKKKDSWDFIKQHSGSHTIGGFGYVEKESSAQTSQADISDFLRRIDRLVMRLDLKTGIIYSGLVGEGKYNKLKQIQSELENLKCENLNGHRAFRICQQRYRDVSKRLDEIGGIP